MNKIICISVFSAAVFTGVPAHAQLYAGISAGESRTKLNGESLNAQFLDFAYSSSQTETDQRGAAYRVFGGYQLNRYVGLEAGYVDFGKSNIRANVVPTGSFERRIKTVGVDISLVGTVPVTERLALFARAGALSSERKTRYAASGDVEILAGVQGSTARQTKAVLGAGLTYNFTNSIALRAEFAQTDKFPDELLSEKSRIDMYSVGLQYRFR